MEGVVDMTADQKVLDLSVIIPALDEGASIGDLVSRVNKHLLVLVLDCGAKPSSLLVISCPEA
jgi:hypothetical protein